MCPRCEDRIRIAKDTSLHNLPLHCFDQNRIWCTIAQLACELTTWIQMLALPGHPARLWESERLRLRLFSIAARISCHARRTPTCVWPPPVDGRNCRQPIVTAATRLDTLPAPT